MKNVLNNIWYHQKPPWIFFFQLIHRTRCNSVRNQSHDDSSAATRRVVSGCRVPGVTSTPNLGLYNGSGLYLLTLIGSLGHQKSIVSSRDFNEACFWNFSNYFHVSCMNIPWLPESLLSFIPLSSLQQQVFIIGAEKSLQCRLWFCCAVENFNYSVYIACWQPILFPAYTSKFAQYSASKI